MIRKHFVAYTTFLFLFCNIARAIDFDSNCDLLFIAKTAKNIGVSSFDRSSQPFIQDRLKSLARFNESAWLELMDYFVANGDASGSLNYELLPLLINMPDPLRTRLDARMREAYNTASKDPTTDRGERRLLAPKRALVSYLHHTSDAIGHFKRMKEQGHNRMEALDAYMNDIRSRLPDCSSCQYNADQVFRVAETIQQFAITAARQNKVEEFEFTLFGSFPNGRANISSSDLDVLAIDPEHAIMLGPYYQRMGEQIARWIPGAKMSLGFPSAPITPVQASTMSPIQIIIRHDSIQMVIYPDYGMSEQTFRLIGTATPDVKPMVY